MLTIQVAAPSVLPHLHLTAVLLELQAFAHVYPARGEAFGQAEFGTVLQFGLERLAKAAPGEGDGALRVIFQPRPFLHGEVNVLSGPLPCC